MSTEDFDQLCKLLALKRYEQPPPGYFETFSRQVTDRLRAGSEQKHWLEQLAEEASWLRRIWSVLEAKPIMAGAFGAAVCCLMLVGIVYSERIDQQPTSVAVDTSLPLPPARESFALNQLVQPASVPTASPVSSTSPVIGSAFPGQGESLFDKIGTPKAQQANAVWPWGN